jgi:hypothetical protein
LGASQSGMISPINLVGTIKHVIAFLLSMKIQFILFLSMTSTWVVLSQEQLSFDKLTGEWHQYMGSGFMSYNNVFKLERFIGELTIVEPKNPFFIKWISTFLLTRKNGDYGLPNTIKSWSGGLPEPINSFNFQRIRQNRMGLSFSAKVSQLQLMEISSANQSNQKMELNFVDLNRNTS